jgi:rfaE bifunctional protein nucleotidyltransferase chain/domain
VAAGIGGHVIKCGLAPLLIEWMQRGWLSAIAMNGAAAIHDVEIAVCGSTSEDVAAGLEDGSFGMARETGEFINGGIADAAGGYGAALGRRIVEDDLPHRDRSVLAAAAELGIPATVHVAIGADIVHQHPSADGGAIGRASYEDFRTFCSVVASLEGGAYLNIGSAVILPEVFLKALTVARNLGHGVSEVFTADFDMIRHYRPRVNVVERPTLKGGTGTHFTGHHEIMVPLLDAALHEALGDRADAAAGKIVSWDEAHVIRERLRAVGATAVFTNGCFDLVHRGHVTYLQKARSLGDALILGLNSDDSVRRLKGEGRPILPMDERAFLLAGLEAVDHICVFDEDTPLELIRMLQPDILVKGGDYTLDGIVGREIVEAGGSKVMTVPVVEGRSTTEIVNRIKAGG